MTTFDTPSIHSAAPSAPIPVECNLECTVNLPAGEYIVTDAARLGENFTAVSKYIDPETMSSAATVELGGVDASALLVVGNRGPGTYKTKGLGNLTVDNSILIVDPELVDVGDADRRVTITESVRIREEDKIVIPQKDTFDIEIYLV